MPVLADHTQLLLTATPYDASALPGKCVVSPAMEILHCWTGHGNDQGFEAIVTHWEASR
jgi:hypothetical protein